MIIQEMTLCKEIADILISLSTDWEKEDSCHGYRANSLSDLEGRRIFLATDEGKVLGYLFGRLETASRTNSIISKATPFFELEELYVRPEASSCGIGKQLLGFLEARLSTEEVPYLFLSTATKNWKSILHFYLDELGMEFWNARLFKRLPSAVSTPQ